MLYSRQDSFNQRVSGADTAVPYCVYESYINDFVNPKMVIEKYQMGKNAAIAFQLEKYDAIGLNCAARCINSILAKGAIPESFSVEIPDGFADQLIPGLTEGCFQGCCSLSVTTTQNSVVTGIATGILDMHESRQSIKSGDCLIGLLSSGLHYEGLVKAAEMLKLSFDDMEQRIPELSCTIEDELFKPAKIFVRPVLHISRNLGIELHGLCYVMESSFIDSLYNMLPDGITADILTEDFPIPEIYDVIVQQSGMSKLELFNHFNMGIGMVMAVDKKDAGEVMSALIQIGEHPYVIGCCVDGEKSVELKW